MADEEEVLDNPEKGTEGKKEGGEAEGQRRLTVIRWPSVHKVTAHCTPWGGGRLRQGGLVVPANEWCGGRVTKRAGGGHTMRGDAANDAICSLAAADSLSSLFNLGI